METSSQSKEVRVHLFLYRSHQAIFQPRLYLLGIPLSFNPTSKFLGVTFDRTLSFGAHVQFLCSKFYPRHKALRSIATASWIPTKESLSLLYKALCDRCSHMPLLVGSHSSATPQPITWKSYTELHAGLFLDASLPPPPPYSFFRPNFLL